MKAIKRLFCMICLMVMVFNVSACAKQETASETDIATKFLTVVYTTNQNNRYSVFERSDKSDNESLIEATDAYYADIETLVNEEVLDELMSNRVPLKYDSLYLENPITVETIELGVGADEKYDFTVTAKQGNEDVIFTGIVGFDENREIDYFYEKP